MKKLWKALRARTIQTFEAEWSQSGIQKANVSSAIEQNLDFAVKLISLKTNMRGREVCVYKRS